MTTDEISDFSSDAGGTGPDAGSDAGPDAGPGTALDPVLSELAAVHGVATRYVGADDREVTVAPDVVRAVLGLLDVDTTNPVAALAAARDAPWRRLSPVCVVVRRSAPAPVVLRVPVGTVPVAELEFESGGRLVVTAPGDDVPGNDVPGNDVPGEPAEHRTADGRDLLGVRLTLPAGLPLGDHILRVRAGTVSAETKLIVAPDEVPAVPTSSGPAPSGAARAWGWMVQLYALRSAGSWGIGDYADLAALASWSGSVEGRRADVLLVNPVHAIAPTIPVEPSPYYPASRRFASALYLRPEDLPEYGRADAAIRARVDQLAAAARAGTGADLIDRDTVWRAKRAALELLFTAAGDGACDEGTVAATTSWDTGTGTGTDDGLIDFATWCALADLHGRDWRAWPADLQDPHGRGVGAARAELRTQIAFHIWLQRSCDAQLAAAQAAARDGGMAVGVVHDLAVGVDPGGADAWALRDVFATGATIGAPPDGFNQQGQDWALPPWRPDRLAEIGYAPFRQMVTAVLRRGGGLRVDHILGLFRLWWIPGGNPASAGTYVRYDADAMLGILALEATRAGALVVGEDLGTVEPSVATMLAGSGVLGSTVVWFERDAAGAPVRPHRWRELAMASVTTHDLPTVAGYLTGEHVRVRARRGLLRRSEEAELAAWREERDGLIALLRDEGLLADPGAGDPADPTSSGDVSDLEFAASGEVAVALHGLLARSPSRIVLAAPGDAMGDLRQPNLPGTVDSYPNWKLPVTDADGRPVTIERLRVDPRVRRLARLLACVRDQPGDCR